MLSSHDHTNHQSFLNFCKILRNFPAISKFRAKGQIPQLGLKFHRPQKTVGANHDDPSLILHSFNVFQPNC